jgi:hypothetical protein
LFNLLFVTLLAEAKGTDASIFIKDTQSGDDDAK